MIKIHNLNIIDLKKQTGLKDIVIPGSVDDIKSNKYFQLLLKEYPELESRFDELYSDKTFTPGNVLIIPVNDDLRVIIFIIKAIEKYAAVLIDILDCIDNLVNLKDKFFINKLIMPVFDYSVTKLLDQLAIPAIIDYLSITDIRVNVSDENNKLSYLANSIDNNEQGSIISWKTDSIKETKFFSKDDVLLAIVLKDMFTRVPKYRLTKNGLIKLYIIFKDNGYFQNIEFYKTEYGYFFREFMMKMNFMINHGILFNIFRRLNTKKVSFYLGNNYYFFEQAFKSVIGELNSDRYKMFCILKKNWEDNLKRMNNKNWNNKKNNNQQNNSSTTTKENPFAGF